MEDTRLGSVLQVSGSRIRVIVDGRMSGGVRVVDGYGYRVGQPGTFVRIAVGYVNLYGVVVEMSVDSDGVGERRIVEADLVGEVAPQGGFERGISQLPAGGAAVYFATRDDLSLIYGGAGRLPGSITIGTVVGSGSVPALIDGNLLVARHSLVCGATGSGKSTTVVAVLSALTEPASYPAARVLILDAHGEFATTFGDRATVLRIEQSDDLGPATLFLPYWALSFEEMCELAFGGLDDAGSAVVMQRVLQLKRDSLARYPRTGVAAESLSVDSPVPFSIHQLWLDLHTEMYATHVEVAGAGQTRATWALGRDADDRDLIGDAMTVVAPTFRPIKDVRGDTEKIRLSQSPVNLGRPLERLAARLRDPRYDFLFRPGRWTPQPDGEIEADLDAWLSEVVGGARPIVIFDLSGMPSAVGELLTAALLRMVYDALYWAKELSEGGRKRPLLIVIEEAHQHLHLPGPATAAVARIAREGRKYGIGLMLVSQRPSDIDSSVLSQCGTMVALRITNGRDRAQVTAFAGDEMEGLLGSLPLLRTGEAIMLGEAVTLPARIVVGRVSSLNLTSMDATIHSLDGTSGWNRPRAAADYSEVVAEWRSHGRTAPTAQVATENHEAPGN